MVHLYFIIHPDVCIKCYGIPILKHDDESDPNIILAFKRYLGPIFGLC